MDRQRRLRPPDGASTARPSRLGAAKPWGNHASLVRCRRDRAGLSVSVLSAVDVGGRRPDRRPSTPVDAPGRPQTARRPRARPGALDAVHGHRRADPDQVGHPGAARPVRRAARPRPGRARAGATRLLARPTDGDQRPATATATPCPPSRSARRTICIHWVPTHRRRPAEQDLGQQEPRGHEEVWAREVGTAGLPPAGQGRQPRRQRQVRRLPQGRRRRGLLRLLRPGAAQARPQVAGVRLLRARQRLRRARSSAPGRARACGSPPPTSSSTPSSSPTTTPRTVADGGHRHLDGGAVRRRRQRQPPVPPARPGRKPGDAARPVQPGGLRPVRQLGVLRVPQQPVRQRHRPPDLGRNAGGTDAQPLDKAVGQGAAPHGSRSPMSSARTPPPTPSPAAATPRAGRGRTRRCRPAGP